MTQKRKNIVHIIGLCIILVLGFFIGQYIKKSNKDTDETSTQKPSPVSSYTDTQGMGLLMTVEHDSHLWVIYRDHGYKAGMGGVEHHPDCQCQNFSPQ